MKNSHDSLNAWLKNQNETLNFVDFRGFRRFINHFFKWLKFIEKVRRKNLYRLKFCLRLYRWLSTIYNFTTGFHMESVVHTQSMKRDRIQINIILSLPTWKNNFLKFSNLLCRIWFPLLLKLYLICISTYGQEGLG